jgi:predicted CXXCH cytochrome family protein
MVAGKQVALGVVGSLWMGYLGLILSGSAQPPAASAPAGAASKKPVDMQGKTCTAAGCHDTLLTKKFVHGPVAQGTCPACHEQAEPAQHAFRPSYPPESLCKVCHIVQDKNYVHTPSLKGDCGGCHDPHQSDYRFMLREDPAQKLCLLCHDKDPFMKLDHLHAPAAAGACILCHESHSSWYPKLLIREAAELCRFCHADVRERVAQARHVHEAMDKGCTECHDPHGSRESALLHDREHILCIRCHDSINEFVAASTHRHGALTTEHDCGNCHGGHGSNLPRLLKATLLDLCLRCHDRPIEEPDGSIVADMARLLRENPFSHGPVQRADCSGCHNSHASSHFRLLSYEYPKLFYAPFALATYDLCFQCHLRDMVLVREGQGVTRFKNGPLNLHFVHVNNPTKGRTCRACHEVHASKNPFHMCDRVPFGSSGWAYTISFVATEHGGRCAAGCHEPRDYTRPAGDPVLPPPKETFLQLPEAPSPEPGRTAPAVEKEATQ